MMKWNYEIQNEIVKSCEEFEEEFEENRKRAWPEDMKIMKRRNDGLCGEGRGES